jgi:hypothetical protein
MASFPARIEKGGARKMKPRAKGKPGVEKGNKKLTANHKHRKTLRKTRDNARIMSILPAELPIQRGSDS